MAVGAGVGCTRSVSAGSRGSVSCICGIAAADSSISTANIPLLTVFIFVIIRSLAIFSMSD